MNQVIEELHSPFGLVQLTRFTSKKNEPLRAWDAADEYLLKHCAEQGILPLHHSSDTLTPKVLLINDAFGALATTLHHFQPTHWGDSAVSQMTLKHNAELNHVSTPTNCLRSTDPLSGEFDVVLIKIPKTTALLEDQLIRLKPHLHSRSVVIAAAMVKHLQNSAFDCFERILGPVTTSLAVKKARLLFASLDNTLPAITNPYPSRYHDTQTGLTLLNHANVFSRERADFGSLLLLSTLQQMPNAANVVDLACGCGILGIAYQRAYPEATLEFIDESFMAVASAELNYQAAFNVSETHPKATFTAADGLQAHSTNSCDLILCNPPFHQQHAVGEHIAQQFFMDSKRCLKQGGQLWLVCNHHLNYKTRLQTLFGNCKTVASNKKFVVLRVIKR